MSDDYIPDPFKGYEMKYSAKASPVPAKPPTIPLQYYEDMDEVLAAKRIKAVLLSIAFDDEAGNVARIAAIDKWMDRVIGKPVQMSVVQVNTGDEVNKALKEIKRREIELGYVIDNE